MTINSINKSSASKYTIEAESLDDLLEKAKKRLLIKGKKTMSQRGPTWSLNNMLLIWKKPSSLGRYSNWPKKDDEWYQNIFVRKLKGNVPEKLAGKGDLVFPYKYAHRSVYYDSGWGYVLALVRASEKTKYSLKESLDKFDNFKTWLSLIGEKVHLQTAISVILWWGSDLHFWLKNKDKLKEIVSRTREDMLEKIIKEVKDNSRTRRAITPSFIYSLDYKLSPMMGVPVYQNFQLLPDENTKPISSLHWHRSLDVSSGAQLDFNHDYNWLSHAGKKTKRKIGSIAILVGNLHLYGLSENDDERDILVHRSLEERLNMWTDGYRSGEGIPKILLEKEVYLKNAKRAYAGLKNA